MEGRRPRTTGRWRRRWSPGPPVGLSLAFALAGVTGTVACAAPRAPSPTGDVAPPERVGRSGPQGAILIENERGVVSGAVDASLDAVWPALGAVYEALELNVTSRSRPDGFVAAEGFRMARIDGRRPSRWVDCGVDITGPVADDAFVTATVATFLEADPTGGTVVRTQVDASARRRDSATGDLHCSPTGRLEALILERIREHLGG